MKYKYIGGGQYFQGLPATDIDESTLTDEQKALIPLAVEKGLYTAGDQSAKPSRSRNQTTADTESTPSAG